MNYSRFTSTSDIYNEFYHDVDGMFICRQICNQQLINRLTEAACDSNYWLSRSAIDILSHGYDFEEDVSYVELLSTHNWAHLLKGKHTQQFIYSHIDDMHGWPYDLLHIDNHNVSIIDYIEKHYQCRDAIMELFKLNLYRVLDVVYDIDIHIWNYILQLSQGQYLITRFISKYDHADQRKLLDMIKDYR